MQYNFYSYKADIKLPKEELAMSWFGKKKEEKREAPTCTCACGCPAPETADAESGRCPGPAEDISCIKVLGTGCAACHALYEAAKTAVAALGLAVEVEYITDLQKIMEYGVMRMPALVVNETVVSAGTIQKAADVEKLLAGLRS